MNEGAGASGALALHPRITQIAFSEHPDVYHTPPDSSERQYKSRQVKKTICSVPAGWWLAGWAGGGDQIHPENVRKSGRHGAQ